MKFKANSKDLLNALEEGKVADISTKEDVLYITFSDYKQVEIDCMVLEESPTISQPFIRWDLVKETLRQVDSQNVVVNIKENGLSGLTLTFAY